MTKMTLDMLPKDSRGIADLYVALLSEKNMFKEAIAFIESKTELYPMPTERKQILADLHSKAGND
jgi:hypothetical protein